MDLRSLNTIAPGALVQLLLLLLLLLQMALSALRLLANWLLIIASFALLAHPYR